METESIKITENEIEITLKLYTFLGGDERIVYFSSLNLSSHSLISMEEAKENMHNIVELFFETHNTTPNKIRNKLTRLGWMQMENEYFLYHSEDFDEIFFKIIKI